MELSDLAFFISPLILVVFGVLVKYFKASFLIAGFNTSPKREKEKYDVDALCRFVGNLLFKLATILLLIALAKVLNIANFTMILWAGFALFFIVIIASIIYINTGNRFKK